MMRIRRAFTMIELIMVIVVLGIVGMIVIEVLAQAYKGAFYQQKYAEREVELEQVITIIEKRLKDALVDSIVLLDKNGAAGACEAIGTQSDTDDFTAAFIAVDRDSMNGMWNGARSQNGWSEDANISIVGANTVLTSPDANFSIADTVISTVFPGKTILDAAVYRYPLITDACTDFRWTGAAANALDIVTGFNAATPTRLTISGATGLNSQQTYRLAASAYAFKRNAGPAGNTGDGTLIMYSNFQPWLGDTYLANGTAAIVAEHVSHFAIRMDSGSAHSMVGNPSLTGAFYRINVCMKVVSDTNDTVNTAEDQICKEKSVYVR